MSVTDTIQTTLDELLEEIGASRINLRLERPGVLFPVVGEALAPGAPSMLESSIDIGAAPTFQFLEREKRILVQDDVFDATPALPREVIDAYGVRAQILSPIVNDGRLAGIVAVADVRGPRDWSERDVEAVVRATTRVAGELGMVA